MRCLRPDGVTDAKGAAEASAAVAAAVAAAHTFEKPITSVLLAATVMDLRPKLLSNRLAFELTETTRAKLWGDKKRTLVLHANDTADLEGWATVFRENCPLHYQS